jgi:hypothetical protein
LFPEQNRNHGEPEHNHDVGPVEYTSVERANLHENEVGDEALPCNPINQIAGATSHRQGKTQERWPSQPGADNQPDTQHQQTPPHSNRENRLSQRRGKRSAQTQEGSRIFGQPQLSKPTKEQNRVALVESGAGEMFRGLIPPNGDAKHEEYYGQTKFAWGGHSGFSSMKRAPV